MTVDAARMHALACQYALNRTEENLSLALEAALPLCALIARRFSSGRGAEYEDLYQVACLACVGALRKFDPGMGFQFVTYAAPTVSGTVRHHLRDKERLLRTPRALQKQAAQLDAARQAFLERHRQEPTPRQLAKALGWDLAKVASALAARSLRRVSSLDQRDEEGLTLADRLPFLEGGFEKTEQREDLRRAMGGLTETERSLLSLRFFENLSQRETARRLNMTQMQISRAERRALAALRKEMTGEP